MSPQTIPFTISADLHGQPRRATRCNPASAMCLADDWAEDGCSDIRIADRQGIRHSPDAFRAKLPLRRRIEQRRLGMWLS